MTKYDKSSINTLYQTILYSFSRSVFQCVCVLGYCLLPIACAALTTMILTYIMSTSAPMLTFMVKLTLAVVAFLWAIYGMRNLLLFFYYVIMNFEAKLVLFQPALRFFRA